MTKRENTMTGLMELIQPAQQLFAANPMAGSSTRQFWETQERMLAEAENFTSAWFQRRNQATRAAMQASEKLSSSGPGNPAVLFEIMSEWQKSSIERMTADARECGEMLGRCAGMMVQNEVEAVEETANKVKKSTKTADAQPV